MVHPIESYDRTTMPTASAIDGARGDDWIAVTDQILPVDRALAWSSLPDCGAVVTFCGTVRDHSEGRPGVTALEYEIYPEHATPGSTRWARPPVTAGRCSGGLPCSIG